MRNIFVGPPGGWKRFPRVRTEGLQPSECSECHHMAFEFPLRTRAATHGPAVTSHFLDRESLHN